MVLSSQLLASYSYSEPYTYGTTNVITNDNWYMPDYLPDSTTYPIVDINAVIYQYSTQKRTQDDMVVHVQNKDTRGTGYIFRETDDWSGLPSGSINKFVPVDNIPASYFGDGSIEVEGNGTVTGHTIKYNYRIDTAVATPKPDIIPDIPETPVPYNALEDDAVSSVQADVDDLEEEVSDDTSKKKVAEKAAKKAIGIGATQAQLMMLAALQNTQLLDSYMTATIDGGVYKEDVTLKDAKLPENRKGLRNGLAQQILHKKMVDSQY